MMDIAHDGNKIYDTKINVASALDNGLIDVKLGTKTEEPNGTIRQMTQQERDEILSLAGDLGENK